MPKRRTNMSIEGEVLEVAREHDLNVSAICETALRDAGRRAQAEAWKKENAVALASHLKRLEKHGTRLAHLAACQLPDELR